MSALDRGLRRELAKAVRAARKTAEAGARNALTALTVAAAEPDSSLSEEDRALRRRLRAHGRQLGDLRQGAEQEVGRLAHEVAYEHWHRMLFARFLAENGLLVEPTHGVPVSLDECRDIARESRRDIWAVAAEFATAMLPRIFRPDDPSLAVRLPPETQRELERTLAGLPSAVFLADDALGWTYQFWQADRKDEVNRSGVKIGADELPAVTQLFTEPYMVRFLFHNTVGAWRAGRLLAEQPELARSAETEEILRQAVRLDASDGYDFDYLRFVREPSDGAGESDASGPWRPAAGSFDKWPTRAAQLRILDPCCGSGHFLVEGLHLLVRLRMEEEGFSLREALRAVLRDNLHGLEIDPRCAQIAAFSVAFAAWKLAGGPIELPPLHIACSGLAPNATKGEWLALVERAASAARPDPKANLHGTPRSLRRVFEALHGLFLQAPTLGSLLDPRRADESVFREDFDRIRPLLDSVLAAGEPDLERRERAVAASGIADAARLLASHYSLVVTNVPYLGINDHDDTLRDFVSERYPLSKHDLATVFMERSLRWLTPTGSHALVLPQNWWFLPRYRRLRAEILSRRRWRFGARLGEHAFEDVQAAGAFASMTIISADTPETEWRMAGIDVSASRDEPPIKALRKALLLRGLPLPKTGKPYGAVVTIRQANQLRTPDSRILLRPWQVDEYLASAARSRTGTRTSDNPALLFCFWEPATYYSNWLLCQSAVTATRDWGGCDKAIRWDRGEGMLHEYRSVGRASIQGRDAWGSEGVIVSLMSTLPASLYTGAPFDMNAGVVLPLQGHDVARLWVYLTSPDYRESLRIIDRQLKLTTATLLKVPFDSAKWQRRAEAKYPNGLPGPYSDDPTQWLFHGHPCGSVVWDEGSTRTTDGPTRTDGTVLQVAVTRLCGYRWPAERDPEMRLAEEQRAWVKRCADLERFTDEDGIVCLSAVRGEKPAADRLRELLVAAYGNEWSSATEQLLLRAASADGRPAENLDDWLRRHFFAEHCSLFRDRPLVWHIWDGRLDGFHALVNYHRLTGPDGEGRRTLEALIFAYIGDWIERQEAARDEETPGAEGRLAAALELRKQLQGILKGEPPFDLFIRWKPLHRQPLGWDPDIDDGVRLNIRPFLRAELRKGLKGAGLLRAAPNIEWAKDRGQEPRELRAPRKGHPAQEIRPKQDYPWFWSCPGNGTPDERTDFMGGPEFDGNRWNDLHYTRAAKRVARVRHERESTEKPSDGATVDDTASETKTA